MNQRIRIGLLMLFMVLPFKSTEAINQTEAIQAYWLEVYTNLDFQGSMCYANSRQQANIHSSCDNQISSIKLTPGWIGWFFRDPNQQGPSMCITSSDANLNDNQFSDGSAANDSISSFVLDQMSKCPAWIVYNDPGYQGERCYSTDLEHSNIHVNCAGLVSALLLAPGNRVRVFAGLNQRGPSRCFTQSVPDLSIYTYDEGGQINDSIRSFIVTDQPQCPPGERRVFLPIMKQ